MNLFDSLKTLKTSKTQGNKKTCPLKTGFVTNECSDTYEKAVIFEAVFRERFRENFSQILYSFHFTSTRIFNDELRETVKLKVNEFIKNFTVAFIEVYTKTLFQDFKENFTRQLNEIKLPMRVRNQYFFWPSFKNILEREVKKHIAITIDIFTNTFMKAYKNPNSFDNVFLTETQSMGKGKHLHEREGDVNELNDMLYEIVSLIHYVFLSPLRNQVFLMKFKKRPLWLKDCFYSIKPIYK